MPRKKFICFLIPSLIGILGLYLIPYMASWYYAFTDAQGGFVGWKNFADVLRSTAFQTAAINTLRFLGICVPLNVVLPFLLAYALHCSQRQTGMIVAFFMLPLVVPTGATVYFWKAMFAEAGWANSFLGLLGLAPVHWFQSGTAMGVVILAFLFKNIGFNLVLFLAGLGYIPKEQYEAAAMDGANGWQVMTRIVLPNLIPTLFMAILMSIINSFKIFREIFLLFGNYPHASIYQLQHYMNNQFAAANLQKLSAVATVMSIAIAILVVLLLWGQRRLNER